MTIESANNKKIKQIRKLHKKKYRKKLGKFLIEGIRFIDLALDQNADITGIFYSENFKASSSEEKLLEKAIKKKVDIYEVKDDIFKNLAFTDSPQGIIAIVNKNIKSINYADENSTVLIVDRVQDPGNLGTILRTADAAGFSGVILSKGTVDLYNDKVLRSTMGSIFNLSIETDCDLPQKMNNLQTSGYTVYATDLSTTVYYDEIEYSSKSAIIIGNEANGISDDLLHQSNYKTKIPILGSAESLNAAIAAGIIMYEIVRQKRLKK